MFGKRQSVPAWEDIPGGMDEIAREQLAPVLQTMAVETLIEQFGAAFRIGDVERELKDAAAAYDELDDDVSHTFIMNF